MAAPFCPTCGSPLRWIPEANGWGCDRCRQMVQVPQAPQAAAPPPRRSRGLLFALIGLVVVGATVAIVVVATRGKKIDCEKYVEKQIALATAGTTGDMRDELEKRVHDIAEDACANGQVSDKEAECSESSSTHDELLSCLGLGK